MSTFTRSTMRHLRGLAGIAACAAGLGSGGHVAAQVLVQPVVVDMAAAQRTAVVSLAMSETTAAPMRLQAQVLRWTQDAQGNAVTEPADDVLVSPAIAVLRPGHKQLFRIALRNPRPLAQEAAYRLVLEDIAEVPLGEDGKPRPGLTIRMRYDLPVLVAPAAKHRQELAWRPCAGTEPSAQGLACVQVHNAGNRRLRMKTVLLEGEGWEHRMSLGDGGVLLAGASRELRYPLPAAGSRAPRQVQVETARGETLRAQPPSS